MSRQTYILTRDGTRVDIVRHATRFPPTAKPRPRPLRLYSAPRPEAIPSFKDSENDDFDLNEWLKTAYGEGVLFYDVSPIHPAWAVVW